MSDESITAWVTKRPFTQGIIKVEGRVRDVAHGKTKLCYTYNGAPGEAYAEGHHWHRTYESALRWVRHRRDKERKMHEHQAKRFADMEWPDTEPQQAESLPCCPVDEQEKELLRIFKERLAPEIDRIFRKYLRDSNVTIRNNVTYPEDLKFPQSVLYASMR